MVDKIIKGRKYPVLQVRVASAIRNQATKPLRSILDKSFKTLFEVDAILWG